MSEETQTEATETAAVEAETKPAAEVVDAAKPSKPKTPEVEPVTARDWAFLAVVAIGSAAADLWTKAWALHRLSIAKHIPPPLCTPRPGAAFYEPQRAGHGEMVLIKDLLDFQYAENCGGAFGFLHGTSEALRRPFFLLVTIGAIGFIVHLFRTMEPGQRLMKWALPLVLGGAIGNLVDRVRLGFVVDFIHAHWRTHHWPTFNVADIAITVGIGLMVLEYIIGPKKAPRPSTAQVASATSA